MGNFWKSLAAVVLGNAVYFLLMSHFPPAARHAPKHLDLGLIIDFWFCLAAYGLIDLVQGRRASETGRR